MNDSNNRYLRHDLRNFKTVTMSVVSRPSILRIETNPKGFKLRFLKEAFDKICVTFGIEIVIES